MVRRIRSGGRREHAWFARPGDPVRRFEQSGWGREKGREVLDLYTEVKSVVMSL
jgi:phenylacetaldehyde dehydrogenase